MKNLLFALLCVFLMTGPLGAQAQDIVETYRKPMPTIKPMEAAAFEKASAPVTKENSEDGALSYRFRLPARWEESLSTGTESYAEDSHIFSVIGSFYGPAFSGYNSRLFVEAERLGFEQTPEQWLVLRMVKMGGTVQGLAVRADGAAEALYVTVDRGVTYVQRAVAFRNGPYIIFARYMLPEQNWEAEKAQQASVMDSFAILKSAAGSAEDLVTYHFLDIAAMKYPKSWELRAKPARNLDRFEIELFNLVAGKDKRAQRYQAAQKMNGVIGVRVVSLDVLETDAREIETIKADFHKQGLVFRDMIARQENIKTGASVVESWQESYKVGDSQGLLLDYEIWVSVINTEDYHFFLTLLTPGRNQDIASWTRNTETYKQVIAMLQPDMPDAPPPR
ncbi:MAG: hypothetical protein L6Q57_08725 [Alphaproteobacteria bacterium]|nr:hypothetical protein [Alphaproteobacteria bacterium]